VLFIIIIIGIDHLDIAKTEYSQDLLFEIFVPKIFEDLNKVHNNNDNVNKIESEVDSNGNGINDIYNNVNNITIVDNKYSMYHAIDNVLFSIQSLSKLVLCFSMPPSYLLTYSLRQ
jgi:hypothetical protein